MKQGDLEPDLVIDITGPGGDLSTVESWRIIGRLRGETEPTFDDPLDPGAVVVDPEDASKAVVTRAWVAGDTDISGTLLVEVEAQWPGGRKQTFPTDGYAQVRITDDLG